MNESVNTESDWVNFKIGYTFFSAITLNFQITHDLSLDPVANILPSLANAIQLIISLAALIGLIIESPVSALKAIIISETTANRICPSGVNTQCWTILVLGGAGLTIS